MTYPHNTSFSATVPRFQFAWDSVSRGAAKRCPRYYQLTIIEGWQSRTKSVDLQFGIWMHGAREIYYRAKANGKNHDDALEAAVDYALRETWDMGLGRAWTSDHPTKNRFTLIRSIVWYLDQWKDDPLSTLMLANGRPAVELSYHYKSGLTTSWGEDILLAGHIDRLITVNNMTMPTDLKTTKSTIGTAASNYFDQFSPDDQMSGYCHATMQLYDIAPSGVIIDAIQVAVGFSRMLRGHTPRSRPQIDEWFEGFRELTQRFERYAADGFWPMNEKACFMCDMRAVCRRPPQVRDKWLSADYVRRTWDPLIQRGDA